jgi:maltose alpha-D-glucosyltransferase/alpha-amylase
VRPVLDDPVFGYGRVNAADQRRDPASLLNWTERRIRMRKECPELGRGDFTVLKVDAPGVLAIRYDFRGVSMLTVHNFASRRQTVAVDPRCQHGDVLVDVFDDNHSRCKGDAHAITLPPFAHRWYRVGSADNALNRTQF